MCMDSVKISMDNSQEYKNILIIKLSSLGDICHALPSLAALRKLYPKAKISWAVNKQFADLLVGHPLLDEVIIIEQKSLTKGSFGARYQYFKKLRAELKAHNFDLVLDLQGLFKSSVIALMTGCPNRYGYWELREGSRLFTKAIKGAYAQEHVIQRYLDVIRFFGSDVQEPEFVLPDIDVHEQELHKLGLDGQYIVLAPATSWASKEWPADNYVELGIKLINGGWKLVLVGGTTDIAKSAAIVEQIQNSVGDIDNKITDLTGKTTLKQLMAVCKNASLYISGDTGPLHIAACTEVPIIAMYGPTMPDRTGPYISKNTVSNKKTIVLSGKADCAPCRRRVCSPLKCMQSISVDEVYAAAEHLLCDKK